MVVVVVVPQTGAVSSLGTAAATTELSSRCSIAFCQWAEQLKWKQDGKRKRMQQENANCDCFLVAAAAAAVCRRRRRLASRLEAGALFTARFFMQLLACVCLHANWPTPNDSIKNCPISVSSFPVCLPLLCFPLWQHTQSHQRCCREGEHLLTVCEKTRQQALEVLTHTQGEMEGGRGATSTQVTEATSAAVAVCLYAIYSRWGEEHTHSPTYALPDCECVCVCVCVS